GGRQRQRQRHGDRPAARQRRHGQWRRRYQRGPDLYHRGYRRQRSAQLYQGRQPDRARRRRAANRRRLGHQHQRRSARRGCRRPDRGLPCDQQQQQPVRRPAKHFAHGRLDLYAGGQRQRQRHGDRDPAGQRRHGQRRQRHFPAPDFHHHGHGGQRSA